MMMYNDNNNNDNNNNEAIMHTSLRCILEQAVRLAAQWPGGSSPVLWLPPLLSNLSPPALPRFLLLLDSSVTGCSLASLLTAVSRRCEPMLKMLMQHEKLYY